MFKAVVSVVGLFLAVNSFAAPMSVTVHCSKPAAGDVPALTVSLEPEVGNTYQLSSNNVVVAKNMSCRFTPREHRMFFCEMKSDTSAPSLSVHTVRVVEDAMTSLKMSPFSRQTSLRLEVHNGPTAPGQNYVFTSDQCVAK